MQLDSSIDFSCSRGTGMFVPYGAQIERDCIIEAPVKLGTGYFSLGFIGAFTYTNGSSMVRGVSSIGRFCSIADGVTLGHFNHPVDMLTHNNIAFGWVDDWNTPFHSLRASDAVVANNRFLATESLSQKPEIAVGNDVWIAQRAIVLPGVQIGDGAIIGAGSVVTKNVPAYAIVAGNPAKVIKQRFAPEIVSELLRIKWWDYGPDILKGIDMSSIEKAIVGLDAAVSSGAPKYDPPRFKFRPSEGDFTVIEPD